MSQYGMNMPGGMGRRGPTINVYTGLLFMAVVALAVACGFMYVAASKVGPDGNAFGIHEVTKGSSLKLAGGKK